MARASACARCYLFAYRDAAATAIKNNCVMAELHTDN